MWPAECSDELRGLSLDERRLFAEACSTLLHVTHNNINLNTYALEDF